MRRMLAATGLVMAGVISLACTEAATSPQPQFAAWGPETPNFNVEVILRNDAGGFGLVKFRQPNDAEKVIYLDTWVRDLAPNTGYRLQRAVDTNIDGVCSSAAWLTLGQGLTPAAILTDENGTGRAALYRSVAAFPVGAEFDIHFRVIEDATSTVVLESQCYHFTISL